MSKIVSTLKKVFLFFSLLVLFPHHSYPQLMDLPFEDISLGEGAPTNVQYIYQDRTGYLWFATWSGLYKYDGYSFVSYRHDVEDSTSILGIGLRTIYDDKAGVLWIGGALGLEKFDRTTGTFSHYTPDPSGTEEDESNSVLAICEDRRGVLWVGTRWGLYQLNRATGKFSCLRNDSTDPGSISHNCVNVIYEDKEGSLWFGTGSGLDRLDFETGKFVHYWNDPGNRYKRWLDSKYWILSLHEDESGILWLGTTLGLVEFNPKKGSFWHYLYDPKKPWNGFPSICDDAMTGSVWASVWDELLSFDRESKTFTHFNLKSNCVYGERSGTLWVGTNTGVKKLSRTKQAFKKYSCDDMVCAISRGTEGILWMFTFRGVLGDVLKFDTRKDQFVPYFFGKGAKPDFVYGRAELRIRTEKGEHYLVDSLGNVKPFLPDSVKRFNDSISWSWKSRQGYWLGTLNGGFYLLEPQAHRFTKIRNLDFPAYYICEDSFGVLWISSSVGKVSCYDPTKDTLINLLPDPRNHSSISGRVITQIYEDKKRRLWFATDNGLNRLERSTNSFVRFTERDGLPSSNIRGMLEDAHGFLWLNTTGGISKFDPETNRCKNYDVSYGLELPADVYYGCGCTTSNGEMFFPGARGFTRFHPDSVRDNPFIPSIAITSVRKFDKPFPFSSEIRLPYDENFISFEFVALSYKSPERNQYAYKMEGLDKDWVYAGTRRYASYPGLNPGEYIFRVKGSNNDGVWNEEGTSVAITIMPPWWKTGWAYAGYAIMIVAGLVFARRIVVARERLKHRLAIEHLETEKLHEVDRLKSRFFSNISHEFRTPLTLILGPVEQALSTSVDDSLRETLSLVKRNAQKLHGMINELLEFSRIESGNVKLVVQENDLVLFVQRLVQSFQSWAERKRITLSVADDTVSVRGWYDAEKLEKILNNLISNALKFSPEEGRVVVSGETTDGTLRITVEDTGAGIAAEHLPRIFDRFYRIDESHRTEGTGIGLALTKELVELHHGTISVQSEVGKGSTFTVIIPIDRKAYAQEEIAPSPVESGGEKTKIPLDLGVSERAPSRPEAGEAGEKPVVLVVEDNADVRTYMKDLLLCSYHVLEAEDGEAGIEKAQETVPDLVISDVMMPKRDGYEVCRTLKLNEKTSHIPVILLTAKAASESKIEGLETGADDYLIKPFEAKELVVRVKNLIELRRKLRQSFSVSVPLRPGEIAVTSMDDAFLKRLMAVVEKRMSDETFSVEELGTLLDMSRVQLHRKITALTNQSASEFIRYMRLHRAMDLLKGNAGTVSEIAYTVGFSDPSHFSRRFHDQFGVPPSEVRKNPEQHTLASKSAQPS